MTLYPDHAGFKERATSKDAADAIEGSGRAATLRKKVLDWFEDGNTGTADECADALHETILAIRPRVSELHNKGLITRTGARRRSSGGRMAHVWCRAEYRMAG